MQLSECRIVAAPPELDQLELRLRLIAVASRGADKTPARRGRIENEMAHPFWMAHRISHCDVGAARHPKQRELLDTGGLDNRLQVLDVPVQGDLDVVPVG